MSGKPRAIHVDNGSEFHSEALRRGCEVHGIRISYRPVGSPHYGGIIERVIGTMMKMIHELPGTTFSNIAERGEYDSDKKASLTLAELEKWFALAISSYHLSIHSGIKEQPITRWMKAVLKPWITSKEQGHKFIIRRDPRDLSRIYALHPKENVYVEVPYQAIGNPAITLWEHKLAIRRIKEEGRKTVSEEDIIKVIEKMRMITTEAVAKSKSARRKTERLEHLRNSRIISPILPVLPCNRSITLTPVSSNAVKRFDDIEEW